MLKQQIEILEDLLVKMPDGTLISNAKDGTFRFYHQVCRGKQRSRVYLGEEDFPLKLALAKKRLYKALLFDYQNELDAQESYDKKKEYSRAEKLMDSAPIRQIICEGTQKWSQKSYPQNDSFLEHCIHVAPHGVFVRSKSEKDIAWGLDDWSLANQYDRKFTFGTDIVSPDFTILHPTTRKLILWEHFGMMDNPEYARKTYHKLDIYMKHGFFPGENLIVTFEDGRHPLTHDRIEAEIHYHFSQWTNKIGKRQ